MKWSIVLLGVLLYIACSPKRSIEYAQRQDFQLSPPLHELDSFFFKKSAILEFKPSIDGAKIHLIDMANNSRQIYKKPLIINESTSLSAVAIHEDFQSSDTISIQTIKTNDLLCGSAIVLSEKWDEKYPGRGIRSLTDNIKGSLNFHDGKWLGFQAAELSIEIKPKTQVEVGSIRLSILENQASWIFMPFSIGIYNDKQLLVREEYKNASLEKSPGYVILEVKLPNPLTLNELVIRIQSLDAIPEWHAGKGQLPWFFIDEILIN